MSLIYGRINFSGLPLTPDDVHRLKEESSGPFDRQTIVHIDNMVLGHCMLFNTPESKTETQPIQDELYLLVADIRLDNRHELIRRFDTKQNVSDADLLLKSYYTYGKSCVDYLIGAFAFVIVDRKRSEVFCARDQMGSKPFFYFFQGGVFVFSTTKRGILAHRDLEIQHDSQYLINLIANAPQNPEHTAYKDVLKLLPAHKMTISKKGLFKDRYWDLDINRETYYRDKRDYKVHMLELLEQSIKDRCRSHLEVGTELSGGLDSSGVTVLAQRAQQEKGKSVRAFSYMMKDEWVGKVFPYDQGNEKNCENSLIRLVCRENKIEHSIAITGSSDKSFVQRLDLDLEHLGGVDEYGGVHHYIRSEARKHDVGVILTGFPGDELATSFCRNFYLSHLSNREWRKYFNALSHVIPASKKFLSMLEVIPHFMYLYDLAWFLNLSNKLKTKAYHNHRNSRIEEKSFFSKNFLKQHAKLKNRISYYGETKWPTTFKESQRNHVLRPHTFNRMESENLCGLKYGVESRYPLSDIRLLQYVLSLPIEEKRRNEQERLIFRRTMENILPEVILKRNNKRGSTMPFGHYEYKQRYQERVAFIEESKRTQNYKFLDYNKLLNKSHHLYMRDQRPNNHRFIAAKRQKLILLLLRYFRKQPQLSLEDVLLN